MTSNSTELKTLPSSQGPKKEIAPKTLRFNIKLLDKTTTELDFQELVRNGSEYVNNQIIQSQPTEAILDDSQSSQISEQEFTYHGEDYDLDDPFIDDSEAVLEYIDPSEMKTKIGGFFIHRGGLQLEETTMEETKKKTKKKRKLDAKAEEQTNKNTKRLKKKERDEKEKDKKEKERKELKPKKEKKTPKEKKEKDEQETNISKPQSSSQPKSPVGQKKHTQQDLENEIKALQEVAKKK